MKQGLLPSPTYPWDRRVYLGLGSRRRRRRRLSVPIRLSRTPCLPLTFYSMCGLKKSKRKKQKLHLFIGVAGTLVVQGLLQQKDLTREADGVNSLGRVSPKPLGQTH